MENAELIIGSHVSMGAKEYYLGSVKEALSYGSNTFMFYTGAPQNSIRRPLDQCLIEEGRKLIKESGIDESKIIVHAPYIINIGNKNNEFLYKVSKQNIIIELQRTSVFGCKTLVLHPGAHVGMGPDFGIKCIVEALDEIFEKDGTDVKIALETMSGKGTELGITFEQIAEIINNCKYPERLGVCFDTCHINDYGYDLHDFNHVLEEFDKIIGINKILVVHLNDSKNPIGAHKDRHENLGYGTLGFDLLNQIAHHPALKNVPKILETPYINDKPPYGEEIRMLKSQKFEEGWKSLYEGLLNL